MHYKTLLEIWRSKKSWKHTLPTCPIHVSKTTGEKDISLSDLCSKEKTLTITEKGFQEIETKRMEGNLLYDEMNSSYKYLRYILPTYEKSIEQIAEILVQRFKDYFTTLWDSKQFHFVFASGGMDSRLIIYVLAELRDKLGKKWLGDIHFRCMKPEENLFKRAMEKTGWEKSQYSVYKENQPMNGDYFEHGDFNDNINVWNHQDYLYCGDVKDIKNKTLISGYPGNGTLDRPCRITFIEDRFSSFVCYWNKCQSSLNLCKVYNNWGDVLMPHAGYEFLDAVFRIPRKYFVMEDTKHKQTVSLLRNAMLKLYDDDIPFFIDHVYNLKCSQQKIKYIEEHYHNSKFYKDFSHRELVKNAKPWEAVKMDALDFQLYLYAVMYKNVKGEHICR